MLIVLAASIVLLAPRTSKFSYEYKKGTVWKYGSLVAPFDFPILKTSEQLISEYERLSHVSVPYYRYSDEIVSSSIKAAENLDFGEWKLPVESALSEIFNKGVISDEGIIQNGKGAVADYFYIQKGNRASKCLNEEVFKLADARTRLFETVNSQVDCPVLDSLFHAKGVYDLLTPNLLYDPQTTSLVDSESHESISPTLGYVSAGQLIISSGELVTAEVAQILDSYKKEYEANVGYAGPSFLYWLGNALIALAIASLLFLVILLEDKFLFRDSRFIYIVLIVLLSSALELLVVRFKPSYVLLAPFALSALYLQAFIKPSVTIPVYIVSLLPVLVFSDMGVQLFIMYFFAGMVNIFLFPFLGRGWKQFVLALITFCVLSLSFLGFALMNGDKSGMAIKLVTLFLASMMNVALFPLTYLFEKMFNLVSNSRLSELSDTSGKLLRALEQKAPGTFQHSLQVMNMADAAARAIDANPQMVKTAALYHDIGKMTNPQCFVENESLLNKDVRDKYHYGLTPQQSARDIIRHVTDGVEMARKERLPEVLVDFIRTHHGTSLTGYFWGMHLQNGGNPEEQDDFRYPGPRPSTKEQIVLMLCDSIEAASRTLTSYTPEAYSAFVESIVATKMREGQFDDAEISIKELGILKESIKSYLAQIHHERIAYPKRKHQTNNII